MAWLLLGVLPHSIGQREGGSPRGDRGESPSCGLEQGSATTKREPSYGSSKASDQCPSNGRSANQPVVLFVQKLWQVRVRRELRAIIEKQPAAARQAPGELCIEAFYFGFVVMIVDRH